ncbi:MAG: pentapeptide repeat-containing protein [Cyanobacteria bacterium P01_H01_bin.21]
MKATELLERYQAGQRDFSGKNLRGQNFRGQTLSGAIFADTDICGANFAYANLRGANFSYAKAGLPKRWAISLFIASLLLSAMSGLVSGVIGLMSSFVLEIYSPGAQDVGFFVLASTLTFIFLLFNRGIKDSLASTSSSTLTLLVGYAIAFVLFFALTATVAETTVGNFLVTTMGLLTLAGVLLLTLVGSVAIVMVMAIAGNAAIVFSSIVAFTAAIATVVIIFKPLVTTQFVITRVIFSVVIALMVTGTSIYVGWRAWQKDKRDTWICSTGCALVTINGTSFRRANLTDVNFVEASLKSTDLRQALLRRTCWRNTQNIEQARVWGTYLDNSQICQLVVNGNAQEQSYKGMNLAGLNLDQANLYRADLTETSLLQSTLQKANLASANLIDANLTQANLRGANLANAKLLRAQLEHTDLRDVTLTGAYIENWRINLETKLDNIHCDYVFMHLPAHNSSSENRYRKPDSWNHVFAEGEFADFITPLPKTLDLYHTGVVDICAVAIAFHDLQIQYSQANLSIVEIEKRGQHRQKLLMRVDADQQNDLSELHSEYFKRYEHLLTLPPKDIHALMMAKGQATQRLAGLIGLSELRDKDLR